MSQLSVLESSIITRLSAATVFGEPAFVTVEGVSGGSRSAISVAMRRERTPAAYVAFIEEPLAPEVRETVRGPRFAIFVADRALRVTSDPRQGDDDSIGTFALLNAARSVLDNYPLVSGSRLIVVHQRFIESDDRFAIYELLYRVWPIDEVAPVSLEFDQVAIAGPLSVMQLEIGDFRVVLEDPDAKEGEETYINSPRPVIWRGQVRGTSHAQVWSIENAIEDLIAARTVGEISDAYGQTLDGCRIERYDRDGPRRIVGTLVVQSASIHFSQLSPAS